MHIRWVPGGTNKMHGYTHPDIISYFIKDKVYVLVFYIWYKVSNKTLICRFRNTSLKSNHVVFKCFDNIESITWKISADTYCCISMHHIFIVTIWLIRYSRYLLCGSIKNRMKMWDENTPFMSILSELLTWFNIRSQERVVRY